MNPRGRSVAACPDFHKMMECRTDDLNGADETGFVKLPKR
jgi:hypothetical protein